MHARLLSFSVITPGLRHFVFDLPELERSESTPGEFVSFSGVVKGRIAPRPCLIADAARAQVQEIYGPLMERGFARRQVIAAKYD